MRRVSRQVKIKNKRPQSLSCPWCTLEHHPSQNKIFLAKPPWTRLFTLPSDLNSWCLNKAGSRVVTFHCTIDLFIPWATWRALPLLTNGLTSASIDTSYLRFIIQVDYVPSSHEDKTLHCTSLWLLEISLSYRLHPPFNPNSPPWFT